MATPEWRSAGTPSPSSGARSGVGRGPWSPRHDHAVGVADGDHGGSVAELGGWPTPRGGHPAGGSPPSAAARRGTTARDRRRREGRQGHRPEATGCRPHPVTLAVTDASASRKRHGRLPGWREASAVRVVASRGGAAGPPPPPCIAADHEVFRARFEHLVDLVEQVVELGLDLLALLGGRGRPRRPRAPHERGGLLLHLSLSHAPAPRLLTGPPVQQLSARRAFRHQPTHMGLGSTCRIHHGHP